jgi:hypothetical protein
MGKFSVIAKSLRDPGSFSRLGGSFQCRANPRTIGGGQTLDLVEAILREIIGIRWPTVKLTDTGEKSVCETADYIGILRTTRSGPGDE